MEPEPLEREQFLNQVSALREQGLTVRSIATQLGIHPSRAQRALKALQQRAGIYPASEQSVPPNSGPPARVSFIGRQREMGELKTALEDAFASRGGVVMLVGEPGIGKTRTAQELAAYGEQIGVQVLWGRCYEGEGAPPYWPWVQLLRSYIQQQDPEQLRSQMGAGAANIAEVVPELIELLPDLAPLPALEPEQARFRLFDSIATFLKNTAQTQPLMLVLDDLHWADKSSLLLLQFLARQLVGNRLLAVGCYRDIELHRQHPLSETLGQLAREPVFQRVPLRGLSQEDAGRLIEEATSGVSPSQGLVETIYAHTEGNPFFMTEVIRSLREQGGLDPNTTNWPQSIRIPEGVREVIGQRLNRLSDLCYQTLTAAAVIGREFDFELVHFLNRRVSEEQLLEVIDEALAAHVIQVVPGEGERYQFSHALVQQTLSEELSPSRRVRLHARIGEGLEELYGSDVENHAAELAHHSAEAMGVLGPEKLVRYSLLAGEQALSTYAHEEALPHFQRGLAAKGVALEGTEPAGDAETAGLLFGLGRCHAFLLDGTPQAGRRVTDAWARAFDYYVAAGDTRRAIAIAEYPMSTSRPLLTGLVDMVGRALALVPPDSHEAGWLLNRQGVILERVQGDYDGSQETFGRALAIARREQDVSLEMRTLVNGAEADFFHLRFRESLAKCLRVIEIARGVHDLHAEAGASMYAARSLDSMGDSQGARLYASAMLSAAEKLREHWWLATALWINGVQRCLEGDWEAARVLGARGLEAAYSNPRILGTLALLEYEVGNLVQGQGYLDRLLGAMELFAPGPVTHYSVPALVLPMIARVTETAGRLDTPEAAANAVLASPSALAFEVVAVRNGLAILSVLRRDAAAAAEQYAALESHRGTMPKYVFEPAIDRVLGLLAQTMGDLDQAAEHFEEALAFCRKAGYRPELAWTCHDYAEALLQRDNAGDCIKAVALLVEALSISSELGMRPLRERVVALQERVQSQSAKALAYPDGLTQRELEVLQLIAGGKSNNEIAEELVLSIRTIERHISNIYTKINARGRADATAYVLSHGLAP